MELFSRPAGVIRGLRDNVARRALSRPARQSLSIVSQRAQPAALTVIRLTAIAIVAYELARLVTGGRPVLAPLTALLVVQVTLYQTIRTALERVASVVAGVLVALGL